MDSWYIVGMDELYGGYHGMYYDEIFYGTRDEAESIGIELSLDVMASYGCIQDELESQAQNMCEDTGAEFDSCLEDVRNEDISYVIYKIRADVNLETIDTQNMDYKDIIKEYCEKDW